MTNINNLSRITNYKVFLPILGDSVLYAQGITLPGFSLNPITAYNQGGMPLKLEGDSLVLDPITITLIIDEKFETALAIYDIFKDICHPTNATKGTDFHFNCGVEITNNTGHRLFGMDFMLCSMQSIGPITLISNTDDDIITIDLTFEASYYELSTSLDTSKLSQIIKS